MRFRIDTKIDVRWEDEEGYLHFDDPIGLDDENAKEIATANLSTQADDTYFDGAITFEINGKSFSDHSFSTTALMTTWANLIRFKDYEKKGSTNILLLDYDLELWILFDDQGYRLKTFDTEYEVDDNDFIISIKESEVLSELIPLRQFEQELLRACGEFIPFCENSKIPVNPDELASFKESYEGFVSN